MSRTRRVLAALLAAALVPSCFGCSPGLPAAERGRRLAERTGCFNCHGPDGTRGAPNPGRTDRTVPNFTGDVMMYAKTEQAVREWIRDGVPAGKRASTTWRADRERGTLRMPAFGRRLDARQIEDLVAFVSAMAGRPEPEDSLAAYGLDRAEHLGCTSCHGPGGRFARPNPGSLRGFIPPWDGPDFPDLVRDRAEFDEWVERGITRRFDRNPLAQFFLRRAPVKMPAFKTHLEPGDLDALWGYVRWLRSQPAGSDTASARASETSGGS